MSEVTVRGSSIETRGPSSAPNHVRPEPSILLVDDQPARLLTYEAILSGLGVNCVRAQSGRDALEKLLGHEFAVLLLDVHMPEMDGFELARLIREHPRLERTPIIFVTAVHVTELDQLKGYEVGAIDYISVPIVPEILRSKVALLVELHQRRNELARLNLALQDTRARLETEHAKDIEAREAQLRAVFEHPDHLTIVFEAERDPNGAITDFHYRNANGNTLELLGLPREQVIGRRLSEVVPERAERAIAHCRQVLETREPVRYETEFASRKFQITLYPGFDDAVISSGVDITERKRAELALRDSERRSRALMEKAPVGIAHNAMGGRFEYVNAAFCELTGYTAEELLAKTWQEITHRDDIPADESLARRVLNGEISHYTVEKRYVRKDGEHKWVSLYGNFVTNDDGQPIQGVAIAVDISERKRADKALRDSQERLVLAKSASRLGIFDWDVDTDIIQWDERTYELWGLKPGEPVTLEVFFAGVHPDDRYHTQKAIDAALETSGNGRFAATYRVNDRADGLTRWIEANGRTFIDNGNGVRLIGTVQDVTERRLAEEKLRQSEERFRELANNINQFAWTCDELGKGTWYNDRMYEYSGGTFEDMRGSGWMRMQHPAHIERVEASIREAIATGQAWEDTFPLRGKDGNYRWFLSRAIPIHDESGRVVRWFGTNTDVTESRRLQDALEEADRRKNEFLAMLAHELRNPLAPIRNAAEILARMLAHDERTQSLVSMIQRQGAHLSHILDDLLDVARITQGHIELRPGPLSVRACIESVLETVQPLIRSRNHRLTFTQSSEQLYVNADKVRLEQCVSNLLTNAAKYTDTGGDIIVRSFVEGGDAVIEVIDTGMGITSDFMPRVFDLFAQSERSLDRSEGGLGVGLSVCKRLIEMHGGTVSCFSEGAGHGTTFTIRLPMLHEGVDSTSESANMSEAFQRVLIVDDNQDAADSLAMCLQMEGHQTKAVYSAESALEQVVTFRPKVVILDIGLPGMDGYEVARRIRAMIGAVRLIALSGYGQEQDKERSAAAGFDVHLIKPTDLDTLIKALVSGSTRD